MHHELTNLLPYEKIRAFRREYFLRLATVSLVVFGGIVIVHSVLLAPSYIYFKEQADAKRMQLAQLADALASTEEQEVGARLARVEADTQYLKRLEGLPSGTKSLKAVLAVPHAGISLTRFAFTASDKPGESKLSISGVAATREVLQRYNLALAALPFVASADLPISTFAKETDLPFLITLTGTMTP